MTSNEGQELQAQYVTESVAAQYLGMRVPTLRKWRAKNDGPVWRKFGRAVRYRISDLEAYAEMSRAGGNSVDKGH